MDGKIINKCRLCNKKKLVKVINFGKIPLGNNLLAKKNLSLKAKKYPLILKNCRNCNHFQLNYSVNPKILYAKNYTYLSGTGKSMVLHLKKYAQFITKKINLKKKSIVLDIGSNDGTCLMNFKKKGMNVLGVDPAKKPTQIAKSRGINSINSFFNEKTLKKVLNSHGKVDFVTSHNTLAHVESLKSIFQNIYNVLKTNGYFCFEVGYFKEVLKNNYFDTIYHEHLDYHHANPLVNFLINLGFSIVDLKTVKIQGGSLRILCKKDGNKKISNNAHLFLKNEKKTIIYKKKFIQNWDKKIKDTMKDARKKIIKTTSNSSIFGYGSPTKIILFLKLLKLPQNKIKYIFEDNKLKQNKYLPIFGNRIISTSKLKKINPKYLLIFAWNFKDDIKKKVYQVDDRIKLLVPLPKFKVI
jgi:SAM-dependent methyltransferase